MPTAQRVPALEPVRDPEHDARLDRACAELWASAPGHDRDGADPAALCAPLARHGVFVDVLPEADGGRGLATDATARPALLRTLLRVGAADLSAGRILEGHVNAVQLAFLHGSTAQRRTLAADVRSGAVAGVWNAEAPPAHALTLDRTPLPGAPGRLAGGKIHCSGLGIVTRPVVTARTPDGAVWMLAPRLTEAPPHDLSGWTVRGMRASATGVIDLDGREVGVEDVVGGPGDYYRAPHFRGGAWRFAAVQAGALLRLASLMRQDLVARRRDGDPHQRARVGAVTLAAETAELWVTRAAALSAEPDAGEAFEAYVNLARTAVERACVDAMREIDRALGLAAFTRPHPVERVARDLATYLRQPFPDAALDDAAAYANAHGAPWSAAGGLAP